jgi:hypothetical protein
MNSARAQEERWRSKGLDSNAVPSPVAGPDVVVLSGRGAIVIGGIRTPTG